MEETIPNQISARGTKRIPSWRFLTHWSAEQITKLTQTAVGLPLNHPFDEPSQSFSATRSTVGNAPHAHYLKICSESVIAKEAVGLPLPMQAFEKACAYLRDFTFSDPLQVEVYGDENHAFLERSLLLVIKIFGFRYLGAARITKCEQRSDKRQSSSEFRYDTLKGHTENGCEWFTVVKDHLSGEVTFKISAAVRPGDFPNWWSHIGYWIFSRFLRRQWHRTCHRRFRNLLCSPERSPIRISEGDCP